MPLGSGQTESSGWKALRLWFKQHWILRFAIAVAGTVFFWGWTPGVEIARPNTSDLTWILSAFVARTALALFFLFWVVKLSSETSKLSGKWQRILATSFLLLFSCVILRALVGNWRGPEIGTLARWGFGIGIPAFILLFPLPIMALRRKAERLATQGEYDRALRISRKLLRFFERYRPLHAWLLLDAGQFSDAEAILKLVAFDPLGHPRLTSDELYLYATALMNEDKCAGAEELFKAAVFVPQKTTIFHFGLADCLLSQNKEAEHAKGLIQEVLTRTRNGPKPAAQPMMIAQCRLIDAWALALLGRREESVAEMTDALADPASLNNHDLAELAHLKGTVWQALGDNDEARAAYREALTLFPHGSLRLRAQKRLAELVEQS